MRASLWRPVNEREIRTVWLTGGSDQVMNKTASYRLTTAIYCTASVRQTDRQTAEINLWHECAQLWQSQVRTIWKPTDLTKLQLNLRRRGGRCLGTHSALKFMRCASSKKKVPTDKNCQKISEMVEHFISKFWTIQSTWQIMYSHSQVNAVTCQRNNHLRWLQSTTFSESYYVNTYEKISFVDIS